MGGKRGGRKGAGGVASNGTGQKLLGEKLVGGFGGRCGGGKEWGVGCGGGGKTEGG